MRPSTLAIMLAAGFAASAGMAQASCPALANGSGVEIYPTSQVLPSNLLRMYVYFPRPMRTGNEESIVRLVEENGHHVSGAFLEIAHDLWSPDRTRLTLLLDPARVKTGLVAHEDMGRALIEGARYRLIVSSFAPDDAGCPVAKDDTSLIFEVGPPDLAPPAPGGWALTRPTAGTMEPLVIVLGSPHDHLSLAYRLRILDGEENVVPGVVSLEERESRWRFVPRAPWQAHTYRLAIDPRLEDLAGNRPGQLFDRPLDAANTEWSPFVPFTPGSPE